MLFQLSVDLYRYSTVLYAVYICISKVSKAHLIYFVDQHLWKCYKLSCLERANTCWDHSWMTVQVQRKRRFSQESQHFLTAGSLSELLVAYHYQSFIGRDFKAWIQMSLLIIHSFITDNQKKCRLSLAQVSLCACTFMILFSNMHFQ